MYRFNILINFNIDKKSENNNYIQNTIKLKSENDLPFDKSMFFIDLTILYFIIRWLIF